MASQDKQSTEAISKNTWYLKHPNFQGHRRPDVTNGLKTPASFRSTAQSNCIAIFTNVEITKWCFSILQEMTRKITCLAQGYLNQFLRLPRADIEYSQLWPERVLEAKMGISCQTTMWHVLLAFRPICWGLDFNAKLKSLKDSYLRKI